MTQTSLNGTCVDSTIGGLLNYAETNPNDGMYLYKDPNVAPSGANASTPINLHNYMRVVARQGVPVFNNADLASNHVATITTADTYFWVEKLGYFPTAPAPRRTLYKISGGTYINDYLRREDVEI